MSSMGSGGGTRSRMHSGSTSPAEVMMSGVTRKPVKGFPTRSHTNQAVQPQKMARGLEFRNWEEGGLFYLFSENKGTDQLLIYTLFFMPPTLKKLMGHIAFGACVGACVGGWVTLFVPTVTFKQLKLES